MIALLNSFITRGIFDSSQSEEMMSSSSLHLQSMVEEGEENIITVGSPSSPVSEKQFLTREEEFNSLILLADLSNTDCLRLFQSLGLYSGEDVVRDKCLTGQDLCSLKDLTQLQQLFDGSLLLVQSKRLWTRLQEFGEIGGVPRSYLGSSSAARKTFQKLETPNVVTPAKPQEGVSSDNFSDNEQNSISPVLSPKINKIRSNNNAKLFAASSKNATMHLKSFLSAITNTQVKTKLKWEIMYPFLEEIHANQKQSSKYNEELLENGGTDLFLELFVQCDNNVELENLILNCMAYLENGKGAAKFFHVHRAPLKAIPKLISHIQSDDRTSTRFMENLFICFFLVIRSCKIHPSLRKHSIYPTISGVISNYIDSPSLILKISEVLLYLLSIQEPRNRIVLGREEIYSKIYIILQTYMESTTTRNHKKAIMPIIGTVLKAVNIEICGVRNKTAINVYAIESWSKLGLQSLVLELLARHKSLSDEVVLQATCCLSNLLSLNENSVNFIQHGDEYLEIIEELLATYTYDPNIVKFTARCITNSTANIETIQLENLPFRYIAKHLCSLIKMYEREEEVVFDLMSALLNLLSVPSLQGLIASHLLIENNSKIIDGEKVQLATMQSVLDRYAKDGRIVSYAIRIFVNLVIPTDVLNFLFNTQDGQRVLDWMMKEWRGNWSKPKYASIVFNLFSNLTAAGKSATEKLFGSVSFIHEFDSLLKLILNKKEIDDEALQEGGLLVENIADTSLVIANMCIGVDDYSIVDILLDIVKKYSNGITNNEEQDALSREVFEQAITSLIAIAEKIITEGDINSRLLDVMMHRVEKYLPFVIRGGRNYLQNAVTMEEVTHFLSVFFMFHRVKKTVASISVGIVKQCLELLGDIIHLHVQTSSSVVEETLKYCKELLPFIHASNSFTSIVIQQVFLPCLEFNKNIPNITDCLLQYASIPTAERSNDVGSDFIFYVLYFVLNMIRDRIQEFDVVEKLLMTIHCWMLDDAIRYHFLQLSAQNDDLCKELIELCLLIHREHLQLPKVVVNLLLKLTSSHVPDKQVVRNVMLQTLGLPWLFDMVKAHRSDHEMLPMWFQLVINMLDEEGDEIIRKQIVENAPTMVNNAGDLIVAIREMEIFLTPYRNSENDVIKQQAKKLLKSLILLTSQELEQLEHVQKRQKL